MENLEYFDQIEQYHQGAMTDAAKTQFEEQLAKNEALAAEYRAYQAALKVSEILGHDLLKEKIKPRRSLSIRYRWSIAAAILILLVGAGWVFAYLNYNTSVLANHYEQATSYDLPNDANSDLAEAYRYYEQGDFESSILLLSESRSSNAASTNLETQKLLAFSLIESNQLTEAIPILENLVAQTDDENIKWHLVTSYLKNGNKTGAKNLLQTWEEDGEWYNQSQELLKKLDSFWSKVMW